MALHRLNARQVPVAPGEPPDNELIAGAKAGDAASFERLMRRYNQRIFRAARSVLRNDTDAEDVVQETFVRAYQHLASFEGRASVATWLTRIAVHEALSRVRRARVFSQLDDDANLVEGALAPAEQRQAAPEEQMGVRELRLVLTAAVDSLPNGLRTVFVLREVEGLSTLEASEILELTPEAVRVRLHRARGALRRHIEKRLGAEARGLFTFGAARCDRVVTQVFRKLGLAPAP